MFASHGTGWEAADIAAGFSRIVQKPDDSGSSTLVHMCLSTHLCNAKEPLLDLQPASMDTTQGAPDIANLQDCMFSLLKFIPNHKSL